MPGIASGEFSKEVEADYARLNRLSHERSEKLCAEQDVKRAAKARYDELCRMRRRSK